MKLKGFFSYSATHLSSVCELSQVAILIIFFKLHWGFIVQGWMMVVFFILLHPIREGLLPLLVPRPVLQPEEFFLEGPPISSSIIMNALIRLMDAGRFLRYTTTNGRPVYSSKTILFSSNFYLENAVYYTLYCLTTPFQVSQDLSTLDCDPVRKLTLNLKWFDLRLVTEERGKQSHGLLIYEKI